MRQAVPARSAALLAGSRLMQVAPQAAVAVVWVRLIAVNHPATHVPPAAAAHLQWGGVGRGGGCRNWRGAGQQRQPATHGGRECGCMGTSALQHAQHASQACQQPLACHGQP